MAIDIGSGAVDREAGWVSGYTIILKSNPANASGVITSIEIFANLHLYGCIVGTFYTTNGSTLKCRDSEVIGQVSSGYKETKSVSLAVEAGDYIGMYYSDGVMERATEFHNGLWYKTGEYIDPNDEATYEFLAGDTISLCGIGVALVEKTSSDSGSGIDAKKAGEPRYSLAVRADAGSGVDGHKAVAPQSAGESGSGVDALTSLLGILARSDTGLGTDAKLSLAVALIKADTGSGIEAILGRAIALADLGSGLDTTLKDKTSSDGGTGTDTILALLDRIFTEYGYGLDASKFGDRPLLAADTGLGVESSLLRELGEPKYSADVGEGVDASTLASLFTRADSGVATEALTLLAAVLAGDNGQGVDALVEVTATVKDIITSDAGQGVDKVLSYLRKLEDSGQGEENLHLVGYVGRRMRMRVYQREAFQMKAYTSETGK